MATGGIFQLITNDGKQDRMLLATALLNKRLLEIERIRSRNPQIKDPTPTLVDIERTHILFMNAHFKPFAAIGYEYNKVVSQTGIARLQPTGLSTATQFSIPQFGDFFSDMVLHVTLGSVTATNSNYWVNPIAYPAQGNELLAYVDYLGQRIIGLVCFNVNGNPLDAYGSNIMSTHQKFFVTPNKDVGWKRNMGQEVPLPGFLNVNNANGFFGRGAGVREYKYFLNGPQTPAPTQAAVDMWIPLLFWFNTDPRLSIPSVSIPYGQRFLDIQFNGANMILQHLHAYNPALDNPAVFPVPAPDIMISELYINNIFVNPEIHDIFIKRIGFNLIRVHRYQEIQSMQQNVNLLLQNLKWPIETIYVGFQPLENTNPATTLMLTAWDIYSEVVQNTVALCCLQNGYSFATITSSTPAGLTATQLSNYFVSYTGLIWDPLTELNAQAQYQPPDELTGTSILTTAQINWALTLAGFPPLSIADSSVPPTGAQILAGIPPVNCQATYNTYFPTINAIQIQAHGIPLYNYIPAPFFNSYIPYTYGGFHINTPYDIGVYMITFNLYPGSYQPSGYVNISRAREFYINTTSSYISSDNPVMTIIIGIAINFLLISDGSAVLRYST